MEEILFFLIIFGGILSHAQNPVKVRLCEDKKTELSINYSDEAIPQYDCSKYPDESLNMYEGFEKGLLARRAAQSRGTTEHIPSNSGKPQGELSKTECTVTVSADKTENFSGKAPCEAFCLEAAQSECEKTNGKVEYFCNDYSDKKNGPKHFPMLTLKDCHHKEATIEEKPKTNACWYQGKPSGPSNPEGTFKTKEECAETVMVAIENGQEDLPDAIRQACYNGPNPKSRRTFGDDSDGPYKKVTYSYTVTINFGGKTVPVAFSDRMCPHTPLVDGVSTRVSAPQGTR